MKELKTRYDFKMFLEDILVFRAYLIDEDTFYFLDVEDFGVDETYKQIFVDIIKGDFLLKYYKNDEIKERKLPKEYKKEIHSTDVLERIEEVKKVLEHLFGLKVSYEEAQLYEMISFRYDGHALNIDYGLDPKNAGDVFLVSNRLTRTIAANNTNFGEVLQMKERAGSTVVPYKSEKIDTEALEIIKRAIKDINQKSIDSKFANAKKEKYAPLYKNFIKQLKEVSKIKELDVFEVIIDAKPYKIKDISLLKEIDKQLYRDEIDGVALVHHFEKYLVSRPNIYSVVVRFDGNNNFKFHLDNQLGNFEQMLRILRENEDKEVSFKGYKVSEEVVLLTHVADHS